MCFVGCEKGGAGCWAGWAQLPLSLAAMQCSNSQHLPFGLTPRMSITDASLISSKGSCPIDFCSINILRRRHKTSLCLSFHFLFRYVIWVAWSGHSVAQSCVQLAYLMMNTEIMQYFFIYNLYIPPHCVRCSKALYNVWYPGFNHSWSGQGSALLCS